MNEFYIFLRIVNILHWELWEPKVIIFRAKFPSRVCLKIDFTEFVALRRERNIVVEWPENTDPRSVAPLTDHPKKIAEKENKQKYKQKWQKDLTHQFNLLTARVGKNSNLYFCKINRLGHKVILIAYFAVAMYERPWKTCVLWRSRISFAYCIFAILFSSGSCVCNHELDPGLTKNNTTCLLSRGSHGYLIPKELLSSIKCELFSLFPSNSNCYVVQI